MADLPHLASRLMGAPLLLACPKLHAILRALAPRLLGTGAIPELEWQQSIDRQPVVTPVGSAVVPVLGTQVARSGWLDAANGLTGYSELGATIVGSMADPAVRAVLLEIDSPGGEVGGLFDLVDSTRELKAASGKPLWAVASESALSAAYAIAIAIAADRLLVTRTGEVGSIGVVAAHLDEREADIQADRQR